MEQKESTEVVVYSDRFVDDDGQTRVHVTAGIDSGGKLTMEGQDLGAAPLRHFGEDEYEYFVSVAPEHLHRLTLALLQERFRNSGTPTSDFVEWLKTNDIPYEFVSF